MAKWSSTQGYKCRGAPSNAFWGLLNPTVYKSFSRVMVSIFHVGDNPQQNMSASDTKLLKTMKIAILGPISH